MLAEFNGKKPKIDETVYIADSAEIIGDVEIGENSSIWHGAVLRDIGRSKTKYTESRRKL